MDLNELVDEHESKGDYRRANGAPMVSDPNNPGKWLRYSRPSGYAKVLDNSFALNDWKINKAMLGVASSRAMQAQLLAVKDGDREGLKVLREQALDKGQANEAADMGTALHAMTARIEDQSDTWEPPEAYADDLRVYVETLEAYGLVSEFVEVHMCNDGFRAAGTADRIYRTTKPLVAPDGKIIPPGTLILGDLKTGAKLDFSLPGYCVQMAIYADGVFYDVESNERRDTPPLDRNWTILVHLPVSKAKCRMIWCSIDVGLRGALLAHDVKEWDKQWKAGSMMGYDEHEVMLPEYLEPYAGEVLVPQEIQAEGIIKLISEPDMMPMPAVFDEMYDWAKARIAAIGEYPKAREMLMQRWPDGLPSPKKIQTDDQLTTLLDLLDAVEKQHSLPFVPNKAANGKRKSELPIGNTHHHTKGAKGA
jgi:hypothetical protein